MYVKFDDNIRDVRGKENMYIEESRLEGLTNKNREKNKPQIITQNRNVFQIGLGSNRLESATPLKIALNDIISTGTATSK